MTDIDLVPTTDTWLGNKLVERDKAATQEKAWADHRKMLDAQILDALGPDLDTFSYGGLVAHRIESSYTTTDAAALVTLATQRRLDAKALLILLGAASEFSVGRLSDPGLAALVGQASTTKPRAAYLRVTPLRLPAPGTKGADGALADEPDGP